MTTAASHSGRFLQAVIEEARRHGRRRRARYGLVLLVVAAAAVAAYGPLRGTGTGSAVRNTRPLPRNGMLVLLETSGWYGINGVNAASGRVLPVTKCAYDVTLCADPESVDWAADGRRLAIGLSPMQVRPPFFAANPYDGLHVVDVRTGRDRQIVRRGAYGEYDWLDVDWAPDGRQLAYATTSHIVVINADGSGHRVLATGADGGHAKMPSWSPDSRSIAYESVTGGGLSSVYVIGADGHGRRLLADHAGAPAWSPAGMRIAVRGPDRVEFISPDGRVLAPRSVAINGTPAWSPDATKVAVANARSGVWIMNADGTSLRRLLRLRLRGYAGGTWPEGDVPRPAWRPLP